MWIIGLTGALGAGKSMLSKYLRHEGIPVHSADDDIHSLLETDSEVQRQIKALWPSVFVKGKIDRILLGRAVLESSSELDQLESLLYPKLAKRQKEFLLTHQKSKTPIVALDVPLLVEVGLEGYCHKIILSSAPYFLRKQRAIRRKGMTIGRFNAFESHQMKENDRQKYADFVIRTGRDKASALKKIKAFLESLSTQTPPKWAGRWPTKLKRKAHGT